jgi:hypothetical protein
LARSARIPPFFHTFQCCSLQKISACVWRLSAVTQDFPVNASQSFYIRKRSDAMTNILKSIAVAATLVLGTAAISGLAFAGPDSSFYPDHLKNPNIPYLSVGAGSGIPSPYRVGD